VKVKQRDWTVEEDRWQRRIRVTLPVWQVVQRAAWDAITRR
jgi:hypothetical protein